MRHRFPLEPIRCLEIDGFCKATHAATPSQSSEKITKQLHRFPSSNNKANGSPFAIEYSRSFGIKRAKLFSIRPKALHTLNMCRNHIQQQFIENCAAGLLCGAHTGYYPHPCGGRPHLTPPISGDTLLTSLIDIQMPKYQLWVLLRKHWDSLMVQR